jgi:hypothetical protein
MAARKPLDPSPTPWDHRTWGFYCDACQKFFQLNWDGKVITFEKDGECYASYEHWCGAPARYIGYLRDGEPCSHPGCLSHVSHPCEGCGRTAGQSKKP